MANLRIPPHSDEAEKSVLGAILIDKDAIVEVAEAVKSEMFYNENHGLIYGAMIALYENRDPIDVVTVADKLKKDKSLTRVGGMTYLSELTNVVPTSANVVKYAALVKETYIKRQMISAAATLGELAFDDSNELATILDTAEKAVFSLSQKNIKRSFIPIKEALAESFDRLDELQKMEGGLRGVPTGFNDLDDVLVGLQDSNLIILAARPGVGKTALATNIAQFVAVEKKIPVGIFSLEMSNLELVDRMLVGQAGIDAWKMKTGNLKPDDFEKLSEAMGILADSPLYVDDTPGQTILQMRTKARRLHSEVGLKLLVVDYLQLVVGDGKYEGRVQEVGAISQGLKNLARELRIPVLAVSQLSRAVESRVEKIPQLSDLRESGCLTGETLIVRRDTGQRVRIAELVGQTNVPVWAMNRQMKLVPAELSRVFSSGRKTVYEMTLKSGRVIKASANHPFFMVNGWRRLDRLRVGDRIATARKVTVNGATEAVSDNRLILLAHLIGDGCYLKGQPLHYTNSDKVLIEIVKNAAEAEFKVRPRVVRQKSWFHLYLSAVERLARGRRNPIVRWLDEELHIFNQHSREKRIPELIFGLSEEKIRLFLCHLWATDGCIFVNKAKKGPRVRIYYASGSRELADQVAHLLLRLGIISTIKSSKKAGYEDMWSVQVTGKIEQTKFLNLIGGVGEKARAGRRASKLLASLKENPNNDVIPKDAWVDVEAARVRAGFSTREFHHRLGWSYSGTQRHKNGLSRQRLARVCEVLADAKLMNLCQSDVYWDEVKEIRKISQEEVFDATVPRLASFLANDIIVHNSIEQDADVVMFLYKPDDNNLEQYKLNIAKHRNGPLDQVSLIFKGEKIKFFGTERRR